MAIYDVVGARKAGLSFADIADYLSQGTEYDLAGARKAGLSDQDIVEYLNRTNASAWETFTTAAAQEAGSEIRGIRQLAGGELTDTAEESRVRQMTAENPIAGTLGRVVGGLANPSTLLPGAAIARGAKAFIGAGAATGGVSGFLQPQYTEDDLSRGSSTALGAAGGALLTGALFGGVKGVQKVLNKLTNKVETLPVDKVDPEIHTPTEPPKMQESVTPSGLEIPPAVKVEGNDSVPLIQAIEDAEKRLKVEEDLAQGNYTSFLNEVPFRTTETPVFRFDNAFGEDNPFRQANIDARTAAGLKQLSESEKMLDVVYKLLSPQLRAELDDTTISKAFPTEVAQQFAMLRKKEEVLPLEVIQGLQPVIKNIGDNAQLMSEMWEQGLAQGMSKEDLMAMFAPELAAYRSLFSIYGSASNAAKVLRQQREIIKQFGIGVPQLRAYLKGKGQDDFNSFGDFLDAVSAIKNSTDPFLNKSAAVNDLAQKTLTTPKWNDKFGEFVVNSYISGLATISVNALSGIGKGVLLSAERALQALNPFSKVKFGELIPAYQGLLQGTLEGLQFAKAGFLKGTPLDADLTDVSGRNMRGAIGTSPDSTRAAQLAGRFIRIPGKASVGIDEFFKSAFRRMELNAQAYRIASSGKYGDANTVFNAIKNIDTATPNWKNNILTSPDLANLSETVKKNLIEDVTRFAKQATFQGDLGKFGNRLVAFRAAHPGLAWVIPFVKTPINIMKDAVSYTPGGAFLMKEVVGYRNGQPITRALPKDVRVARTAMGLGIVVGLGDLVASGDITGSYPNEPGERAKWMAAQIPEYSIKIGDKWVSYARLEPIATVVGSTVDGLKAFIDYSKKPSYDPDANKDLAIDLVSGVTKNIASKTFLEGISNLLQAAHQPERYGEAFINSFAGLVVPAVVAGVARSQDPNARVVTSFGEAVQARVPDLGLGLPIPSRQELPVASNILGGERQNPAYGFAAFTGLQILPAEQNIVQQEISRLDFKYSPVDKKLRGVELSGEEQALYQKTASDFADRYLANIVQSPGYQNAKDSMKTFMLQRGMRQARTAATNAMLGYKLRDPEFRRLYQINQIKKRGGDVEE